MSLPRYLKDNYYPNFIIDAERFLENYPSNLESSIEARQFLYSQINKKCWENVFRNNNLNYGKNPRSEYCPSCSWIKNKLKTENVFKNTYCQTYKAYYINGFKVVKMAGYEIKFNFIDKTRKVSDTTLSLYKHGIDYVFTNKSAMHSRGVIFDLSRSGILSKRDRMTKIISKMIKANTARKRETSGRIFTPAMRLLIFERDGFRCKICGRHRDYLNIDEHLEADHIKAWVDGGKTKLSNAQTLCSTCNKAKHHVKKIKKELIQ